MSKFVIDNDPICDPVQLTDTQNKGGGGGLGDKNSSTVEIKDECGYCQIFQGATMQRAIYDKMAITNRDKKHNENSCNVWKLIMAIRKTLRNGESVVLMMITSLDNY